MSYEMVSGVEYVQEFVELFIPGLMFAETSTRRISGFDRMFDNPGELPEGCQGYRYFTRVITEMSNGAEHHGEKQDISGITYFGKAYTYDQLLEGSETTDHILLRNMENNNWNTVVFTIGGNVYPVEQNDIVVEPHA